MGNLERKITKSDIDRMHDNGDAARRSLYFSHPKITAGKPFEDEDMERKPLARTSVRHKKIEPDPKPSLLTRLLPILVGCLAIVAGTIYLGWSRTGRLTQNRGTDLDEYRKGFVSQYGVDESSWYTHRASGILYAQSGGESVHLYSTDGDDAAFLTVSGKVGFVYLRILTGEAGDPPDPDELVRILSEEGESYFPAGLDGEEAADFTYTPLDGESVSDAVAYRTGEYVSEAARYSAYVLVKQSELVPGELYGYFAVVDPDGAGADWLYEIMLTSELHP